MPLSVPSDSGPLPEVWKVLRRILPPRCVCVCVCVLASAWVLLPPSVPISLHAPCYFSILFLMVLSLHCELASGSSVLPGIHGVQSAGMDLINLLCTVCRSRSYWPVVSCIASFSQILLQYCSVSDDVIMAPCESRPLPG